MATFWTLVALLVVAAFAYKLACKIVDLIHGVIAAIAKAPGKGLKKLVNAFKGHKETKLNAKLDKIAYKEHIKAMKLGARRNPEYLTSKKAKRIQNKLDAIEIKKGN